MDSHLRFPLLSITDPKQQLCKPAATPIQRDAVRAAANFSAFIDRFLDRIFYLASADEELRIQKLPHERAKVARVTAQVCRRWRTRALNTPGIWLGPILSWYSHPAWLQLVLERSNPLPFHALIPHDALIHCPDTLLIVLKHLPRIQHLNVTLGLPLWQKVRESKYLQQQAPCLQICSINIAIGAEQRRQILIPEQENLFGGWAPGLRQFHMLYCPINLSPKMYSGLRGLYLDMLHLISPVQLLNALRNMTHLEYLHFARAPGNPHLIVETPYVPEIRLANLKELRISESISVSAGIFKNVRFPTSCSIQLGCYHASDGQHLREIHKHLQETLSIWECEQLVGCLTLRISATSMAVTVEVPGVDELSTSIHPHVSLALSWQPGPANSDPIILLFPIVASIFQSCEAPPDSLVVYADTKLPTQLRNLFAQWLRKMDVIQSIELHSNAAFSLLKLRCDVFGDDADVGPGSAYDTYGGYEEDAILLPFLTDLTLVNVNFPTERRRYWKRLMNTLKLRQDVGYPLMLVDFVNCIGNFDLREVGRYVTEVKKDGDDYNDSDDDDSSNDSDYTIQADSDAELT